MTWITCVPWLSARFSSFIRRVTLGFLHDQHVGLVVDQGGQRLLHRGRIIVGVAHDILKPAPSRFGSDYPFPFVLQRYAERNRQEGNGFTLHILVVIRSKLVSGLRPAFLLSPGDGRPASINVTANPMAAFARNLPFSNMLLALPVNPSVLCF